MNDTMASTAALGASWTREAPTIASSVPPMAGDVPDVTIEVVERWLSGVPNRAFAIRLEGRAGAFLRTYWSPVAGCSQVRRTGGSRARTVQTAKPYPAALRDAREALRNGWTYARGTVDGEPLPEPLRSRLRGARWSQQPGAWVLATAAKQGWIPFDLLVPQESLDCEVRAIFQPGDALPGVQAFYANAFERNGDWTQRQRTIIREILIVLVKTRDPDRYFVGELRSK